MELLVQVASGVDYLHSHSPPLIHGDIKPSNVVINDERSAQLCDYGLYKLAHNAADFTSTDDTIRYCAPEVARSGLQSLKADIYALANLIIYSLTGISPRLPTNIKDKRPLPRPSDHPALSTGDRLWPLLMDCLDADPSKRPPIAKVLDELEAERLLRTAAETEFQLHLTGHHLIGKHTLEVGAANEIPRKNVRKMREVALGYFADVYEGTMRTVDGAVIPVAIKSLRQVDMQSSRTIEARHERLNKRLNRENAVWGRLHHPNILPVLGVCPGTEPLLITPWMRNGSMSSYVRNSSHLAFHDKLDLILGAAQGVAYLHSLNPPICHADIKPGNVLISDDGKNALLSDFGLSLALTILRSPDATTGDPQGTRGFQAPELMFQTRRTLSGDVYSFACLILDVLTGHFPYYELAPHLAVLAARNEKMPDPALHPELPESDPLWELMQKCWVYEQYSRPDMDFIVQQARQCSVQIKK
ncbi:hypothetical protein FRB90_012235 [Tulasnella sp. 427]|nr:hypothetical protein FRB90_012235 [Tulasnella sp. 427]